MLRGDLAPVVMSGYLRKRKRRGRKVRSSATSAALLASVHHTPSPSSRLPARAQYLPSWTRRWFVLQGDQLLCYRSRGAAAPSSILSLSLMTEIRRACTDARDSLRPPLNSTAARNPRPDASGNGQPVLVLCGAERGLALRADSRTDLDRWFRAIHMHVRLWREHQLPRELAVPVAASSPATSTICVPPATAPMMLLSVNTAAVNRATAERRRHPPWAWG